MTNEDNLPPKLSLKRWSRRKLEVARTASASATPGATPAVSAHSPPASPANAASTGPTLAPESVVLPSIESLSFDSDFTAFLQPKVDEALKRQALKKLFSDARFNVMDGLDTYIDDYTIADPISPELIRELVQGRGIFGLHDKSAAAQEAVADVPAEAAEAPSPPSVTAADSTAAATLVPDDGTEASPDAGPDTKPQ